VHPIDEERLIDRALDRERARADSGNLVLIGMRACGKSHIGRVVAQRTGRPLLDLDEALAEAAGRDCDTVLAEEGEAAFRCRESEVLREAADRRDHVVATGGGAILCGEAFDILARSALVIYLSLPVGILVERAALRPRPALTSLPHAEEVAALLAARDPLYRAAADRTISASAEDPILAVLELWPRRPPEA
jgi:shikimate kinase